MIKNSNRSDTDNNFVSAGASILTFASAADEELIKDQNASDVAVMKASAQEALIKPSLTFTFKLSVIIEHSTQFMGPKEHRLKLSARDRDYKSQLFDFSLILG